MFKQLQTQKSIDEIKTRLNAIEQVKAPRNLGVVERKVQRLQLKFSNLRTAINVSLAFGAVLLGILSLLIVSYSIKLDDYAKFEAARPEVYKLLVSQLRQDTTEVINKIFLAVVSDELKGKVRELKEKQQSLAKLNFTDKDFESTSGLIEAVGLLIQDKDRVKAKGKLDYLLAHNDDNGYMKSRALAIKALIDIAQVGEHPDLTPELKEALKKAIEIDGTNALAFNCLGVLESLEAEAILKGQKLNKDSLKIVTDLLTSARIEFQVAGGLDVSIAGTYRRANNITWNNLLLIKGYLDEKGQLADEQLEGDILKHLGYTSLDTFFLESHALLKEYIRLRPSLQVAITTELQLICVEAQYRRLIKKDDQTAKGLTEVAVKLFLDSLDNNLIYQGKTQGEALDDFDKKYLYREITNQNPYYAERIRAKIKQVRPLHKV